MLFNIYVNWFIFLEFKYNVNFSLGENEVYRKQKYHRLNVLMFLAFNEMLNLLMWFMVEDLLHVYQHFKN